MVKVNVIDVTNKSVSSVDFGFKDFVREDIFKKSIQYENNLLRQKYGADKEAGKKNSISVSKRRKRFRSTYNKGMSRTPRKTMSRKGIQIRFVGAFASGTRGGRRAHPPKSRDFMSLINNKEWLKSLRIGLVASFNNKLVKENGQKIPETYPFVLDSSFEKFEKTKEFKEVLKKIGFEEELNRTSITKIRAGKGKTRNRKYKYKKGPIIIVKDESSNIFKSAGNILGFEVVTFDEVMTSDFAMGVKPGRCTLFTKDAFEKFLEVLNK